MLDTAAVALSSGTFYTVLLIAMGASDAFFGYIAMAGTLSTVAQFPAPLFWERLRKRKSLLVCLSILTTILGYLVLPCIVVLPISSGWKPPPQKQ